MGIVLTCLMNDNVKLNMDTSTILTDLAPDSLLGAEPSNGITRRTLVS